LSNRGVIVLTDQAPVDIDLDQWPVIANIERNAPTDVDTRSFWEVRLTVRQHADGRAIVYGRYASNDGTRRQAGELLGETYEYLSVGPDIPGAIRRVVKTLDFYQGLAEDCIAALPAVRLD
jgi:hypothetical protein